jgi:hypothetical protein
MWSKAFFFSIQEKEAKHGTRNSAVVTRRSYSGDHSVVAVLRPLISRIGIIGADQAPHDCGAFLQENADEQTLIRYTASFFASIPV